MNQPSFANRTFRGDIENWQNLDDHVLSYTSTADQFRSGVGAGKIVAGSVGSPTECVFLNAGIAYRLSHTYLVELWAKSSTGTPSITLKTTASGATATELNSATWTKSTLLFTAVEGDVSDSFIIAYLSAAATVYIDDLSIYEYRTFDRELFIRGLDHPDEAEAVNPISQQSDDGTIHQSSDGYLRHISIDVGVLTTMADKEFIFNFWNANRGRRILVGSETVEVVLKDNSQFSNQWLESWDGARDYTIECIEKTIRTSNPATWIV
jgi:hypothetical protein